MSRGVVSENNGTPKSSILTGFSTINHPFWWPTPIFGNTQGHPGTICVTVFHRAFFVSFRSRCAGSCRYPSQARRLVGGLEHQAPETTPLEA